MEKSEKHWDHDPVYMVKGKRVFPSDELKVIKLENEVPLRKEEKEFVDLLASILVEITLKQAACKTDNSNTLVEPI